MRKLGGASVVAGALLAIGAGGITQQPRVAASSRSDFAFDGPMIQGAAVLGTAPALTSRINFSGQNVPVAADGRFLIAFDRDAGPSATIVATRVDGSEVRKTLTVQKRAWRIERLDTLPRIAQPSAEFERRRPIEMAQINAARAVNAASNGWRQRFMWPVTGRISGLFGSQRIYNGEPGSYHGGVDVARPSGTPILAPADGVVILAAASPFTLEGRLLMVDHGMGLHSAFLHLSRIDVKVGDVVRRGKTIGAIGMTGRATGPHLHWGMRWRDAKIDPLLVAGTMPATAD
ncbi:M23 family metallopeptidase [Sphingomonas tagetis]|uniref:M23 family metallopeptidase n=1 Tax=Sphingomonas tagetis TaxID=2949092 RepID=UPI003F5744C3